MRETIKILHVFGSLDRGGAESMIMNIYRNIDRDKLQFDFVIHTDRNCDFSQEVKDLGGEIIIAPPFDIKHCLSYRLWWKKFFEDEKNNYRVVHIHMRSTASLYIDFAKKSGIKTIVHSHSISDGKGAEALVKKFLQYPIRYKADYLFACSNQSGIWLFGKKATKENNYYLFKNSIDLSRFCFNQEKRMTIRKEFGLTEDEILFCHIGNFTDAKNHFFLVKLFQELSKLMPSKLVLVGGDNEGIRKEIEEKVNDYQISNRVLFLGVREDIPDILLASDMFLFPSKWEGFPMALLESQASGIPTIISDKIPSDVIITDLIKVLPISKGISPWVESVKSTKLFRKDVHQTIKDAGFDVKTNAKWLEEFYESC